MVEHLLDSQNTGVRFPYRLPEEFMAFQGVFSHRNLHAGEKIQDGSKHNNLHPGPGNHPPVQLITINGVDYFIRNATGNYCNDASLNRFSNKTVSVTGNFVGGILMITTITQVGP